MTMPAPLTREQRLESALRALVDMIDAQTAKSDGGSYIKLSWIGGELFDARAVLDERTAQSDDVCTCGHARHAHIYEEGACRPGFECEAGCTAFVLA